MLFGFGFGSLAVWPTPLSLPSFAALPYDYSVGLYAPAFLAELLAPQSTKFHRVSKANTRIKTKTGLNKHLARPIWMQVNFDSESSDISCFKKNIVLDCQKRSFIWNWRYRQLLFLSTTCFLKKLQVARARENVRTWILPLCCLLYFTCHAHSNELVSVTPKLLFLKFLIMIFFLLWFYFLYKPFYDGIIIGIIRVHINVIFETKCCFASCTGPSRMLASSSPVMSFFLSSSHAIDSLIAALVALWHNSVISAPENPSH